MLGSIDYNTKFPNSPFSSKKPNPDDITKRYKLLIENFENNLKQPESYILKLKELILCYGIPVCDY